MYRAVGDDENRRLGEGIVVGFHGNGRFLFDREKIDGGGVL